MQKLRIEVLSKQHDRTQFDCGEPALNAYLKNLARQHQKRGFSVPYVALKLESEEVIGFYTLASTALLPDQALHSVFPRLKLPPNLPWPAILLGRFAVQTSQQGQGLGKLLLVDALTRVVVLAKQIGTIGVLVDAKTSNAADFYQRNGFTPLHPATVWPQRHFLPTVTIQKLFDTNKKA